jgi:hypothetical protein
VQAFYPGDSDGDPRPCQAFVPKWVSPRVGDSAGTSPEVLQDMRNHLEELKWLGIEAIND